MLRPNISHLYELIFRIEITILIFFVMKTIKVIHSLQDSIQINIRLKYFLYKVKY